MNEPLKRVLLVEPDEGTRDRLQTLLSAGGLNVVGVTDGKEAIESLRAGSHAVILLDLLVPEVDGFPVMRWIGENRKLLQPQPVVLVMTGAEPDFPGVLDAEIVHGVLRRPCDPHELVSLVEACVDARMRNALQAMTLAALFSAPLLALLAIQ